MKDLEGIPSRRNNYEDNDPANVIDVWILTHVYFVICNYYKWILQAQNFKDFEDIEWILIITGVKVDFKNSLLLWPLKKNIEKFIKTSCRRRTMRYAENS